MTMQKFNRPLLLVLAALIGSAIPAYSLQGGPVMPDYVQFEPVDAMDVVNLNTGNFSYSLPLSEVPGPYGGFPLSMSYHAGIGPNQEGSMLGLGWSMNAGGAINRNLRGTPDDQVHGGDLAFIYSYSATSIMSVGVTIPFGPVGLNMSYNSFSGYGMNAVVGANLGPVNLGASFGTSGVGLKAGIGYSGSAGTVGLSGNIGLSSGGFQAGANVGFTDPTGTSVGASIGVSVDYAGKVATSSGFSVSTAIAHAGFSSEGVSAGVSFAGVGLEAGSAGISVSASYGGIGGSVNLGSRGYSASVSVGGSGVAISAASSSTSSSKTTSAGFSAPFASYNRSVVESWMRQATSEHSYGYIYQAGPSVLVDGPNENYSPTGSTGIGNGDGGIPWNWNFKGRSLDHMGDPTRGPLLPGNDVFEVAGQGVSGAFRAVGLSKHEIFMSVEKIGGNNLAVPDDENDQDESQNPNALFYLMKEDANANAMLRRQLNDDFTVDPATGLPEAYTRNAYDYCRELIGDPENVRYLGNDLASDRTAKLEMIESGECSRYAFLKSNHLNEGNRLIIAKNLSKNLDLNRKFRSRMAFAFMGENGGYFESETGEPSLKRERDAMLAALMRKNIPAWRNNPYSPAMTDWDEPILGVRRIEPIIEDGSNIGRLQGFKITNPDGTQYFFTQPVRSLMTASYTTNQPVGGPAFIDKGVPNDGFVSMIEDAAGYWQDHPVSPLFDGAKWLGKLVVGAVSDFLFNSPDFRTPCDHPKDGNTTTYNYSYTMSTNPYATQWLLKEIRGADFVEFDNVDLSKNFGYQVRFNYTPPKAYAWRVPYAPPGLGNDELPNLRLQKNGITPENCLSELYHASFGVKEMVYLQSVETATHKAEMVLNDPISNPRVDGKGWMVHWKGKYTDNNGDNKMELVKEPLFIMVGTYFPIEKDIVETGLDPRVASVYVKPPVDQAPSGLLAEIRWNRYPVNYTIKSAFINIQPTEEQILAMAGKPLLITAVGAALTHSTVALKPHPIPAESWQIYQGLAPGANAPAYSIQPGYTVPKVPALPADVARGFSNEGSAIKVIVDHLERATGEELQFGSYKVVFQPASYVHLTGEVFTDFQYISSQPASTYFANFDPANPRIPSVANDVVLRLTSGGGDFKGRVPQPLMVFNDFIDFNGDPEANQMRRLDRIDFTDKSRPLEPLKRFRFAYEYDIQPGTLNSYNLIGTNPDNIERHANSYPQSAGLQDYDVNTGEVTRSLQGKMKLESVTEVACSGTACADSMQIPPFRFAYQSEGLRALSVGSDRAETIRLTTELQDEWGFYNPHGSGDNQKTRQYIADYAGAAWSLNKITDPAGGTMEMLYERDTYYGETYAEDDQAIPMRWGLCDPDQSRPGRTGKVCLDFFPRKWNVYCDRNDKLQGEWAYTTTGSLNLNYILQKGFVEGSQLLFNMQQTLVAEVGCGLNLGFWKSGSCERPRSISVVGTAQIQKVNQHTLTSPFFDSDEFTRQGKPTSPGPCPRNGPDGDMTCCVDILVRDPISRNYVRKDLNRFWYCNIPVIRMETDLPEADLGNQFQVTMDKLRERRWYVHGDLDNERFGVVWSRQGNSVVRGGDIRVKELIKRDIGLTQRTQYDYGVGQMAQEADSAFSMAFATRFSTGKITDLMGADVPTTNKKFHALPSRSRIQGIGDEDLALLPSANITYPKVVQTNILEQSNQTTILNGKAEYEFHTPEQVGHLRIRIPSLAVSAGQPPVNLYVEYLGAGDVKLDLPKERLDPKALDNSAQSVPRNYVYEVVHRDTPDPNDPKVSQIVKLRFYHYRNTVQTDVQTIDVALRAPGSRGPMIELYLTGSFNGTNFSLAKDASKGIQGEMYQWFDFTDPILAKTTVGTETEYRDYSSRLGKPKSTSFYRWLPDPSTPEGTPGVGLGRYVLIKKDSMIYRASAPSVDRRFIPNAQASKIGKFSEKWAYTRARKCENPVPPPTGTDDPTIPNCDDTDKKSLWTSYKDNLGTKNITYTRYPTFLTETRTFSGFNDSRQPGDPGLPANTTDFVVSSVTNHQFDPITGQPTLSVAHAGPLPSSPSKATRLTPAYVVDPDRVTSDLPNLMFMKNMLEPLFREDVFTFQTTTTGDFDDEAQFLGANGDNGGPTLAPKLTAVKLNPYRQRIRNGTGWNVTLDEDVSGVAMVTEPISVLGSFSPRFSLAPASNLIQNNRSIFSVQPDLGSWIGNRITRVNRFLKAEESQDANGNSMSSHFDPRGFHQTALFANARHAETANLTPDIWSGNGYFGNWDMQGQLPEISRGYLLFYGDYDARHPMKIQANTKYTVEMQVFSPIDIGSSVKVGFANSTGQNGDAKTIVVTRGVNVYRVTLDGSAGWGGPPPNNGGGYFRLWPDAGEVNLKYLRVYPAQGQAQTYVYDNRGDMVQSVDVANVSTYYEYDLFGKLINIRNDDGLMMTAGSRTQTNVEK